MTSASHHFATCCSSTVLPVPKPPGTAAARVSSPETPGGQSTRCSTAPAFATTPSTAPASTRVPTDTDADGVKLQTGSRADWDRSGESHTGASDRRRSNPSKTPPNRPGPRRADSGWPTFTTGSPTRRPPVYSKACTVTRSPLTPTASPAAVSYTHLRAHETVLDLVC